MKAGVALGSLGLAVTLGGIGCGGSRASVTVNGTDPSAIRDAPAGLAILMFLDLEAIRPDQLLAAGASPPSCITVSSTTTPAGVTTTYTASGCTAANTGILAGTLTVTGPVPGSGGAAVYTELFALTVTLRLPATASSPATTQTWTYNGTQQITVRGTTATVSLPDASAPIQAGVDDSATGATRSYAFTPNNLSENLADPAHLALSGGWGLAGSNGDSVTCTITDPFVWVTSGPGRCAYPVTGSLAVSLAGASGSAQTTASFNGCGNLEVAGATLPIGGA